MSTEQSLKDAFAGESQANRKYTAFARKAEAEGKPNIAKVFRAAAEAETVHALAHFRAMGGVKSTAENVQAAIDGETYEFVKMYPEMIADAEKENTNKAALVSFKFAMAVEKLHADMYKRALEAAKAGKDLPEEKIYVCDVCGHTHFGEAPDKCPTCNAQKSHFILVK